MLKAVALPRMLNPIVRRGRIVSVQHLIYRAVQRRISLFIYQVQNGISVRSHLLTKLRAITLLDEHQARNISVGLRLHQHPIHISIRQKSRRLFTIGGLHQIVLQILNERIQLLRLRMHRLCLLPPRLHLARIQHLCLRELRVRLRILRCVVVRRLRQTAVHQHKCI